MSLLQGRFLDEQLLDLVLEGEDLALELRRLVGRYRARNHGARDAAGASESHLSNRFACRQTDQTRGEGEGGVGGRLDRSLGGFGWHTRAHPLKIRISRWLRQSYTTYRVFMY